jgi:hypothetical protein
MVVPSLTPRPFLQNKFNLLIAVLVVATTIFSQYNPNSWCIILLVFCRLADGGPVRAIKAAFTDPYFLAFLALFLVDAAGQLHTHNPNWGGFAVEKAGTLVAIAFVLCGGVFVDDRGYLQFMTLYCLVLFAACITCLATAIRLYGTEHDIDVFFYHTLSRPIGQNAVFFSVYMLSGLLFLLAHPMQAGKLAPRLRQSLQIFMIAFFTGFIILLSSKLLLLILLLALSTFVLRRYIARKNYTAIVLFCVMGLIVILWLALTDNPVKRRYQDLERGNITMVKANQFTRMTNFNGAQLRLLQWRFADQILRENHAWFWGVSQGDSQDLLNEKYKKAHLDTGIPNTRERGFTDYNFHNQYIEITVASGFFGLAILLSLCWLLIMIVLNHQTPESFFTILTLLLILTVESFLTLQHGIFAFVFIPLILRYSSGRKRRLKQAIG